MDEQNTPDTGRPENKSSYTVLITLLAAGALCLLLFSARALRQAGPSLASGKAGAADRPAPAEPPAPQAPAVKPLGRPLEDITSRHTNEIKPMMVEPLVSGPLAGGVINKYHTGSGTDDIYVLDGKAYRRVMSFRLAEMVEQVEGTHAHFSGLVFIYGLYPSAFDEQFESGHIPPDIQKLADAYGEKCGALAEPGSPPQEYSETHDGYVFSCSNKDTTRLIYGVCSEGLRAAEAAVK